VARLKAAILDRGTERMTKSVWEVDARVLEKVEEDAQRRERSRPRSCMSSPRKGTVKGNNREK